MGRGVHCFLAAGDALACAQRAGDAGVLVEGVSRGFGGEKAGILAGDIIESWSRAPRPPANPQAAHGALRMPFDLLHVEIEQGPRGGVTLTGRREGRRTQWTMPAD